MMSGIALVVQPWWNDGLRIGFFVTLVTTIMYIVVSHIPEREEMQKCAGTAHIDSE